MRSESPPGGRSPWTFSKRADIEDRKIGFDKQKVCWGEGQVHQKNHPGGTYLIEVKKIAKNDITMTINDDKRSTPYNILVERASAKFACNSLRYISGILWIYPITKNVPMGGGG